MLGEESLDVELGGCLLVAEALGVDGAGLLCLGQLSGFGALVLSQWDLALDDLLVGGAANFDDGGGLQRLDDGGVGLEALHAAEFVDFLQRYGLVLGAAGQF